MTHTHTLAHSFADQIKHVSKNMHVDFKTYRRKKTNDCKSCKIYLTWLWKIHFQYEEKKNWRIKSLVCFQCVIYVPVGRQQIIIITLICEFQRLPYGMVSNLCIWLLCRRAHTESERDACAFSIIKLNIMWILHTVYLLIGGRIKWL